MSRPRHGRAGQHQRSGAIEARRILEREAIQQVYPDGVTREQTVSYQVFALQFLIVAGLVGEANGDAFSEPYWHSVRKMIEFLHSIQDVAGNVPDFGDSDEGVVFLLSPDSRATRRQELLDLDRAWSLGARALTSDSPVAWLLSGFPRPANWPHEPVQRKHEFPDGGYYVLGARWSEPDEVKLVFDSRTPGLSCDGRSWARGLLVFTLSIAGIEVLVDCGTYCYHDEPDWRDYFRGTVLTTHYASIGKISPSRAGRSCGCEKRGQRLNVWTCGEIRR
jgi:hypothetical protein